MLWKASQRIKLAAVCMASAGLIAGIAIVQGGFKLAAEQTVVAAAPSVPAEDGKAIYEQHCMGCHAVDGKGVAKYPSIVGVPRTKTYDRAYSYISQNMPYDSPRSLNEEQYKAVTKYVLSLNGIATDFSDIADYWAYNEIVSLFDKKYIDGYTMNGQLLFKPNQPITRAEFVRYLVKAKEMFLSNSDSSELTDIEQLKNNKVYIITAVENGLVQGYPDGTFKPGSPITRAEIAAVLARSEMLETDKAAVFHDVAGHWAAADISAVSLAKLFNGYDDGSFRPDSRMTRGEAAGVIYRLINP
jgi:mono/diheme cytochrome c family protein